MIQKTTEYKDRVTMLLMVLVIFSLSFESRDVLAQELSSVDMEKANVVSVPGTPVEEIISAAESGALSTIQNLSELRMATEQQSSEISISDQLSLPEQSSLPDQSNLPEQSSLPAPAAFTSDSLKNLELQGGLSSSPQIDSESPTVFKLAARFLERAVFRNDVEFLKRPSFDDGMDISGTPIFDKDTAGYAIIKKGNQSVVVDFERKYESSPIITATLSLEQYDDSAVRAAAQDLLLVSNVNYIISRVSKNGFEIMMDHEADSDIPFAWHALAVNKPKTFKKKGESQKNGIVSGSESSVVSENSSAVDGKYIPPNQDLIDFGTGGNTIPN